jgi:atlastin
MTLLFCFQYVHRNVGNWLGHENDRLDGFSWKGGSNGITMGIHMWSDIFTHDYDDGKKIAIILLDTQGTFDSRSTMRDCSTIFALSTLVSSVQIFNLSQNIQEDDLQHLQLFAEYGRLVAEASGGEKPFQKLVFLIRDWMWSQEHEYGEFGGQELINQRLSLYEGQSREHESLREHIDSCFQQIKCFLMPFPGMKVATNQDCQLKLSDLKPEFKHNLQVLVPLLLAPENLVSKKINRFPIKVHEFVEYFKRFFGLLNGSTMPRPMTIFEATAEVHNMSVVNEGQNMYAQRMTEFYSSRPPSQEHIRQQHEVIRTETVDFVRSHRLMGTEEMIERFFQNLLEFIRVELEKILRRYERDHQVSRTASLITFLFPIVLRYLGSASVVAAGAGGATAIVMGFIRLFARR